jgi:hypothetical protein
MLFDENGYIKPYEILTTDIDTFKTTFVFNEHRANIFQSYLELIETLKSFPCSTFHQWLDGSFVSKKPFPNDLDLVNFIDWQVYRKFENRIRDVESTFRWKRLDVYTIPVYPDTDFKKYITIYGKNEKQDLYSTDRLGRPKGIIQLNF